MADQKVKNQQSKSLYETLGASASKAGLHAALENAGVSDSSGLFAKINDDLAGDPNYASFIHCDGAGTKTIVAYLMFREYGDPRVFGSLADDAFVMNLDDLLCIGAPSSLVLANTLARNARLIPDAAVEAIITRYRELVELSRTWGLNIQLSGGETADCGDTVRTLVVDAVLAGRIERQRIIHPSRIAAGDVIVGLSSTGKATYENQVNSGIGSNGLTLARHALLHSDYRTRFPEIIDEGFSVSASGPYQLGDSLPNSELTVGEALLSPTRSYAPILIELFQQIGSNIHAVIHVTGGGLTKVSRFGDASLQYVKDSLFPTPPIFQAVQSSSGADWQEMYQVFNMGHRLEIYCPSSVLETICSVASRFGIEARQIGHVTSRTAGLPRVLINSVHGNFSY